MLDAHREREKKRGNKRARAGEAPPPWIRKVRMGTFEDSGLCKGCVCCAHFVSLVFVGLIEIFDRFAFVDFMSVQYATSALINPKNYSLDGRQLVVEYASAEAVRRGGGGGGGGGGGAAPKKWKKTAETKGRDERIVQPKTVRHHREESTRSRPKPGASLALAKRESAAILPSGQSQKITFT
jgi:RNA recognition motif-containing protein